MRLFYLIFCLGFSFIPVSKTQSRIEIKGRVTDTMSNPLPVATVLILDASDSTYISYTQADNNGFFSIKHKLINPFILRVTYLGYFSFEKRLDPSTAQTFDLGIITLNQINTVLFEIVIKEAKAPLRMRGDTLEYDASTFKVPAGSSVEDLLRRLPGMAVGADGSITSHGQTVNKVTVDGKRFFGDDPTMATKNLPAESVSKVQVFNEKTEQEKLTNQNIDKDQKTMNLELKEEFKKGGFGKILAGIGLEERNSGFDNTDILSKTEVKANYNKFNKKEQLSLIGIHNNTGRNGMNWNDHQDFRGQQSWDWNDSEEIFGFGYGSGDRYFSIGFDDDGDEFGSSEGFFGDRNSGIPKNAQAGINYNYDFDKTKFTGMYSFRQNDLFSEAIRKQQFFLPDKSFFTEDESSQNRMNESHRAEFIFVKEFDSLNSIILKLRGNAVFTNTKILGFYNNKNLENIEISRLNLDKNSDRNNYGWQSVSYYKRKFKNKRRNLGINFIYNENERVTEEENYSRNDFFSQSMIDSMALLDQFIQFNTNIQSIKSSLLYVEPIAKDFSLQFFYNYIQRNDDLIRDVFDTESDSLIINYKYSRYNNHTFRMNRAGTVLQYGKNGMNISAGIATQKITLLGNFQEGNLPITTLDQAYHNILSNVYANYQLDNKRFGIGYEGIIREPSFRNLTPIVDNSNPLFIRIGNPDLKPEKWHSIRLNYYANNKIKFISYNANVSYNYYSNQHISEQTIDSFLITTSRMINFEGGQRFNIYTGMGFPIIKNRFTVNMNYNNSYNLAKSIINSILNDATSFNQGIGLSLAFTPNDIYSVYLDNRWSFNQTAYSIESKQNFTVSNQSYNLQTNARLPGAVFINASLNYRIFNNERFASNYEVPILNVSVYKLFLKGDRLEARISCYDLFNKNLSINQSTNFYQISETQTLSLSRYYMLSLSYNIKGIRASVKKSNDWF